MKKLYEKNELSFALVWIAIYVVGTCLVEMLGETVGTYKLVSAVFHVDGPLPVPVGETERPG